MERKTGGERDDGNAGRKSRDSSPLIEATFVEVDPATGGPRVRRQRYYAGAWHPERSENAELQLLQRHCQSNLAIKRVCARTDLHHPNDKAMQTDDSLFVVRQANKSTSTEGLIPDTVEDKLAKSSSCMEISKKRSAALEQLCYTLSLYDVAPDKLARGLELVLQEDNGDNRQSKDGSTDTSSIYDSSNLAPTSNNDILQSETEILLLTSSLEKSVSDVTLVNGSAHKDESLPDKPKFANLKEEYDYLMSLPRDNNKSTETQKMKKDESTESLSEGDMDESPTVSSLTPGNCAIKDKKPNDQSKVDEPFEGRNNCSSELGIKEDASTPSKDSKTVKGQMYVSADELAQLKRSIDANTTNNCVPVKIIISPTKKRFEGTEDEQMVESNTYIPTRGRR